jgi:predicted ester cyclase
MPVVRCRRRIHRSGEWLRPPGAGNKQYEVDMDRNKQIVGSFITDVINSGRSERALTYVLPSFTVHNPGESPVSGMGLLRYFDLLRRAFPDFRIEVDEVVAEGDLVVVIGAQAGTQQGEYKGLPPYGGSFNVRTHILYRLRGPRIAEAVHVFDRLEMLEQLQPAEQRRRAS